MELTGEISESSTLMERIFLNVGGQRFEAYQVTLASIAGTQLSYLTKTDPSYSEEKEEYFFDRSPSLFPFILEAYRGGDVTFPSSIPASSIKAELLYWGLNEDKLSAESAKICQKLDDGQKLDEELNRAVNYQGSAREGSKHSWWLMLEYPFSSWKAMIWSAVYTLLLILTVMVISCMTLPVYKAYNVIGSTLTEDSSKSGIDRKLIGIHVFCSLVFLIDLIVRFILCPSKIGFFKSFFNIIDILAIFLMVILSMIDVFSPHHWNTVVRNALFAAVSILRALRLFKFFCHSKNLYLLLLAAKASVREYLFLILVTFIGMIIISTMVFYVEEEIEATHFRSIPDAFWYTIVSMTTVGYGDMRPLTLPGKIIGAVGITYGITMAMITIPVFIFNYKKFRTLVAL